MSEYPTSMLERPSTSIINKEALERMRKFDGEELQQISQRYNSSKDRIGISLYSHQAFYAGLGACFMRDSLEKEFRELKKTPAKEYEELPFRDLASDASKDPITPVSTGLNPYNYPRLLPDPLAIRLVVLLPSRERHADIVCKLANSALTQLVSDPYEALSYVWGNPARRRPISVSGQPFHATENLEVALRHLRHPTKPRVLWIDAICINQNDIQERNEQVQLMGYIYRCARRVIVWLGPESDTSGTAFQLMHNKPDLPECAGVALARNETFWAAFLPGLYGFCLLIRRPWFRRVWCVQELALARSVDFQCGQHCATMDDFLWMEETFSNRSLLLPITYITETGLGSGTTSVREDVSFFMKLANLHKMLLFTGFPPAGPDLGSSRSALFLLEQFQDWLCSNDKDRIFAFYGLVSALSPDKDVVRPNYSLSVAQVYIRFAVRYFQQHKDLNILITATRPLRGYVDISPTRELPSWVPDWRDVPRHGRCNVYFSIGVLDETSLDGSFGAKYDNMYDACFGFQVAQLEFRHDFRMLCLHGVAVDRIEKIGPVYLGDIITNAEESKLEKKFQVLSEWKDIASLSAECGYHYTGEPSYEAFWRTLQMDDQLLYVPPMEELAYMFETFDLPFTTPGAGMRHRIPPGASAFFPVEGHESQFLLSLTIRCLPMFGRRFFTTAKGLFGLAPASARVGDDVAVLFGGKAPFVLRPDGESHKVMGECYVHGIMDGEAIHRPRRREFADVSTKEFYLV